MWAGKEGPRRIQCEKSSSEESRGREITLRLEIESEQLDLM